MVTAYRLPDPKLQLFDDNGNPLSGGFIYTYAAGTLTPLATYEDAFQVSNQTNPIILDAAGRANVFWGTSPYDVVVTDSLGNQLYTVPDFTIPSSGGGGGTGGGFGEAADISSSTTVDLGTITSHNAVVTGTTTTNSFGSSATTDAPLYIVKAQSAGWNITLSGSILCPFVTTPLISIQNDYYWMMYLGSGSWKIIGIFRGDGSVDATTLRVTQIIQND